MKVHSSGFRGGRAARRGVLAGLVYLGCGLNGWALSDDQIVYDDARQNGWGDWGWAALDYAATAPVHGGSKAIRVTAGPFEALYMRRSAFGSAPFQSLVFWIHGGTTGGQPLVVRAIVGDTPQNMVSVPAPAANAWREVTISLAALGAANKPNFEGFWIQNNSGAALGAFSVDDIRLTAVTPPQTVQVSVNAGEVLRTIDQRLFGLNLAMWDDQLASNASRDLLASIDTRAVRFPGGSLSDDYDWSTDRQISTGGPFQWVSGARTFANVASTRGALSYVTVNYGSGTPQMAAGWVAWANGSPGNAQAIGTDAKGRNWLTVGHWASLRAAAPLGTNDGFNHLRASRAAPYALRYWEVGNECYGSWEYDQHGGSLAGAAHDAATYANTFKDFRSAMMAVDPSIQIGAVLTPGQDSYPGPLSVPNPNQAGSSHHGWTPGVLATLKALGVTPHFVILHYYAQNAGGESDAGLLGSAASLAGEVADLRTQLTDYVGAAGSAGVEIAVTELNSVSSNPGKQTTSLVNGLFEAEALATLARTEARACAWWDLRNGAVTQGNNSASLYGTRQFGDYGIVANGIAPSTPLNRPYPAFLAAKLLTHWGRGGDTVLTADSDFALLSAHAAHLADGRLALLVINRSAVSNLSAHIALAGFVPGFEHAELWRYGMPEDTAGADLAASTIDSTPTALTTVFPAYSMSVVVLPKPQTFDGWRMEKFTPTEFADPLLSGANADFDRDGRTTLMEYALGFDPKKPEDGSWPLAGTTLIGGKHYLTLAFPKPRFVADVDYVVRATDDLLHWETSGPGSAERLDDGTSDIATYRDLTAFEDTSRRFIGLRVILK